MPWLLALVGGGLGAAWFEEAGLVLGVLGGLLLGCYLRLADRLRKLEREVAALSSRPAVAAAGSALSDDCCCLTSTALRSAPRCSSCS